MVMKKATQTELLRELLTLHESRTPFLDETWEQSDVDRYLSAERFERESARIFRALPQIVAHSSELPGAGSFITVELAGRPLLLVRDERGVARAFYNVCRHRGARLVAGERGCRQRFSCPYHAWTWNGAGQLIGVPHEQSGFPGLVREDYGLHPLHCREFAGWLWVSLAGDGGTDVEAHLGPMADEMLSLQAGDHVIVESTLRDTAANWKILVEGGLESYHFRVAHRETIADLFLDNLSSYRCFGPHMRSVLPRSNLAELKSQPEEAWELGRYANVLYTLFPGSQFLVQADHFVWIQGIPLAPDRTLLRLATLIPRQSDTPGKRPYWRRHHRLTVNTLEEDFELGESIQRGLGSGANTRLNFGRFEGALSRYNRVVEEAIA
jgi:phenylpropionate dioxygenase-like ring-hydroxylating dioxygenase large terminal subunit